MEWHPFKVLSLKCLIIVGRALLPPTVRGRIALVNVAADVTAGRTFATGFSRAKNFFELLGCKKFSYCCNFKISKY